MRQLDQLRAYGYNVFLGNDGMVYTKYIGGLTPPPGAKELRAWCAEHKEEVKDALIFERGSVRPTVRVCSLPVDWNDTRIPAWASVFERGLAELVKVGMHVRSERLDIHYLPLVEEWVIEAELNACSEQS